MKNECTAWMDGWMDEWQIYEYTTLSPCRIYFAGEYLVHGGEYARAQDGGADSGDGQRRTQTTQEQPDTGTSVLWVLTSTFMVAYIK